MIFIKVKNQSDKKTFPKFSSDWKSARCIRDYVYSFRFLFQVARHNQTHTALQYMKGLLRLEKGKANMERMEEEIPDSEYRMYQHFLTNSKWDYQGVILKVGRDASEVMESNKKMGGKPTGFIVDESAHLKKGDKSVGVAKQYAGVVGKVENCQVGVYASLVNGNRAALVNERLFIPKAWSVDRSRCKKAGIPRGVQFKTKPQLALEMVDQAISAGIAFDWIGGDGLYGHNSELRNGLEERNLFYVLDVHKDEKVYTSQPVFEVPQKTNKRGRPSKKPRPDIDPIRLDTYVKGLTEKDWVIEKKLRKTHKGWKKLKVHTREVWTVEDGQSKQLTLVITQTMDGRQETKYSFSNGGADQYTPREYAYFQCQRYWVERTFDDAKNELGMSDYQVRKWNGWHHHHSLVFMAGMYLLQQRIDAQEDIPLMSVRDARILMIVILFGTKEDVQLRLKQMEARHEKIQADIDRHYET